MCCSLSENKRVEPKELQLPLVFHAGTGNSYGSMSVTRQEGLSTEISHSPGNVSEHLAGEPGTQPEQ